MKNADYWKGRFNQLEHARNTSNAAKYREIDKQITRSQQVIENKINAWYGRFALNNGVTIEEARKLLTSSELKELKWDIEDYIKAGKQPEKFRKQLENASAKYHINRLEAIKLQTQMECEKLFGNMTDSLDEHIKNQYADTYYRTAYEVQKGLGYGHSLERINSDVLEQVINKPWAPDEKNFKARLGESKAKLINNIHNSLTQMCLMGDNPEKAIRQLAQTMKGNRSRAANIIMTESAYFSQNAQERCFNALGVEEYEIIATLNSRTCDGTCAGKDGEHYPMKMFEPGVTAPPFHPRCRCATAPYFGDEWAKGERAARDKDGSTYYVPSDMKYEDWKQSFVDSNVFSVDLSNSQEYRPLDLGSDKHLDSRGKVDITAKEILNTTYDGGIYLSDSVKIKRKELHNIETSLNDAAELVGNSGKLPKCVIISPDEMQTNAVCSYNASKNMMYINSTIIDNEKLLELQKDMACPENLLSTYVHEFIHWRDAQDYLKNHTSINSEDYLRSLRKKCKKKLDELTRQGYDINNISPYASSKLIYDKYDEVWTEYRVLMIWKEGS